MIVEIAARPLKYTVQEAMAAGGNIRQTAL
jgi:hypothetical protein